MGCGVKNFPAHKHSRHKSIKHFLVCLCLYHIKNDLLSIDNKRENKYCGKKTLDFSVKTILHHTQMLSHYDVFMPPCCASHCTGQVLHSFAFFLLLPLRFENPPPPCSHQPPSCPPSVHPCTSYLVFLWVSWQLQHLIPTEAPSLSCIYVSVQTCVPWEWVRWAMGNYSFLLI